MPEEINDHKEEKAIQENIGECLYCLDTANNYGMSHEIFEAAIIEIINKVSSSSDAFTDGHGNISFKEIQQIFVNSFHSWVK